MFPFQADGRFVGGTIDNPDVLDKEAAERFGVTRNPTDVWVAQQLREATPFGEGPRFLIRDNDCKYGASFARVAKGTGIEVLRTPYGAPKANDYASYCTSFALSSTTSANHRRPANGRPWLLRGASGPGGSNRQQFLSLYAYPRNNPALCHAFTVPSLM